MQNHSHNNTTPKIVGSVAITAIIVIAALTFFAGETESDSSLAATTPAQVSIEQVEEPQPTQATAESTNDSSNIEETEEVAEATEDEAPIVQTVSFAQDYAVPRGHTNTVSTELTVTDGVVSAVSTDHVFIAGSLSEGYTARFDAGIEEAVVGKVLTEIAEENVSGASLTSIAFFDALQTIQ